MLSPLSPKLSLLCVSFNARRARSRLLWPSDLQNPAPAAWLPELSQLLDGCNAWLSPCRDGRLSASTSSDFAHCLRCTLDHLVYALVTNGTGKLPTDPQIMWPVLEAPNPGKLEQRTRGMASEGRRLIEQLQPYHFSNYKENPIWQLAKLDNIDKHRYLAIYETALDMPFRILGKPTT